MKAKEKNDLPTLFKRILSPSLQILDEWGLVSLSREISEKAFDLLDRRKYSSGMISVILFWPKLPSTGY